MDPLQMVLFIFCICLFLIFYAYFGYPLSLVVLSLFICKKVNRKRIKPSVSLIITAFNEEKLIQLKIENTLQLDYPKDHLQIIIASDGSTDRTNEIVREYSERGIELFEVKKRGGKENAQKEAITIANGEIIVFSDVATVLQPDGLLEIVSNFADSSVGCVSSEDRLVGHDGEPTGEGFYVNYEMWLRRKETEVNSLVGLSGSFFAARKVVCEDFTGNVQSDFRTLLSSKRLGLRGVCDPNAVGHYLNIADERREFARKVRTVVRGMTVFFHHLEFLNVFRYGLFSYLFFCHKLLRWLVPLWLILLLISNAVISANNLHFMLFFLVQTLFYGLALFGCITSSLKGILKIPMYFLVANAAIAFAWYKYLTGERIVLWMPSER